MYFPLPSVYNSGMDTAWYNRMSAPQYALAAISMLAAFALVLLAMGRVPWCSCGVIRLWQGVVQSPENSQQFADWYTFSHIIHGFIFYWIFWLIGRRWFSSSEHPSGRFGLRLLCALAIEIAWEILENSPLIINRYRAVTLSWGYVGDSVLNSVSDVLFCLFGFWLASKLPIWATITLTIIMELAVGYWIRDNLTLNIIMLLYPLEAIRKWQMGA